MTRLIAAALLITLTVAPEPGPAVRGYASRYDPGVFEGVVDLRWRHGWWRNMPPYDWTTVAGYAATTDCDQVGTVVLMRPVGASRWERVLVADCMGDIETMYWMIDNNIAAELDYALFTRWAAEYGLPLEIEMRPAGVRYVPGAVAV